MREQVLWRKVARIIMRLAERLQISPERALAIFYDTRTRSMLHDSKYGLHLMLSLIHISEPTRPY